ncbi:hypothetical protein, partial [Algoriphagus sp.]|uniref:hypothetical protein n=1 Tax=Algoriphagus sp. TaxID=1872435 RepID=UPI003F727860
LSIPMMILGMLILIFWYVLVKDIGKRKNDRDKQIEKNESEPTAHFLVPAEKGFGRKKIRPIPSNHSLASMSCVG